MYEERQNEGNDQLHLFVSLSGPWQQTGGENKYDVTVRSYYELLYDTSKV